MAIDFPASPTNGQTFTSGSVTYTWDGTKWTAVAAAGSSNSISQGNTNATVTDTGSDGRFVVTTEGTERARVDSSGRLLVGTSSARNVGIGASLPIQNEADYGGISVVTNRNDGDSAYICLGKSRGTTAGSNAILQSGDTIGRIVFAGADGTDMQSRAAEIAVWVDGTPGVDDMPGRLVFSTTADGASSPTERMRIDNAGTTKFTAAAASTNLVQVVNDNATPTGIAIEANFGNATGTNTNTAYLYSGRSGGAQRFYVYGNGGIANYSANNSNLSDRNSKKDISPAAGTWDCIKEWEIVNYRYKDQPDNADLNLGVIAQQVAESCPEVITVFEQATEDKPEKLGIKEQQMYWMAIKALQEAQVRIEALEAEVAALKAQ